jgi:multiple sugar transport system substrate-binding protein
MMQKKAFLTTAVVAASALLMVLAPAAAQDKVKIQWFVGLGTGTNDQQRAVQDQTVLDFNASQDAIELELIVAASNEVAPDTLNTLIASGNAPDIIGPVGYAGSNNFSGQWLDLQPLVDASGYDLDQFPAELTALYQTPEGLLGLPFAVFPSFIYYNADLFDEAGVPYPPHEYGAPYIDADGNELEWNWDTLADLAAYLTVDANGNDATSDEFDATAIEQFGFVNQWGAARNDMSSFGGGEFWNPETGEVTIPDNWRAQAKWQWSAVWEKHFYPNATYEASTVLAPSSFASGHTAMARTHLWYTCCMDDLKSNWSVAALPAYEGNYYSTVDADTFRIHKSTDNPEEAFTVLQYLLGEGSLPLLTVYGALPARVEDRQAYYDAVSERYPTADLDTSVIEASLTYAVSPHHESDFPNFTKGQERFAAFRSLVLGDTGADIDVDAELDKLAADLQAIIDEEK